MIPDFSWSTVPYLEMLSWSLSFSLFPMSGMRAKWEMSEDADPNYNEQKKGIYSRIIGTYKY